MCFGYILGLVWIALLIFCLFTNWALLPVVFFGIFPVIIIYAIVVTHNENVAQRKEYERIEAERRYIEQQLDELHRAESKAVANGIIKSTNMNGHDFENFCAYLLERNGFRNVRVTRGSGDHGADIIASKNGKRYAIQCKNYSNAVGNKAVQEAVMGKIYYSANIAVVMTNSTFTRQAIEDAAVAGVELWGKEQYIEMAKSSIS